MIRFIYILLVALMPSALSAESLVDMTSAIEALGSYEVSFTVESQGQEIEGHYAVESEGGRYYFKMDGQEIYGDEAERCTVSHASREVILESAADDAPMLITDPIQAFTMLGDECEIVKVERVDSRVIISLKPKVEDGMVLNSILEVDSETNLPVAVTYLSDDESIRISVGEFSPLKKDLAPRYPAEYEVIDVR